MAHGILHRAAHLRHGAREVKLPRQDVETVVEVVFETAAQTFSGPASFVTPTLMVGNPVQQTDAPEPSATEAPSESEDEDDNQNDDDQESAASSEPTVISAPATVSPTASSVLTDAPQPTAANPINGITSTIASPTASAAASSEGGISAGGTAGLVIGILLMVGVALAGILFLLKRKKQQKQQKERQPIDDDEKGNPFIEVTPAPVRNTPSIRTARTASTAPRLSLRPVTEFDPALEEKRRSAANALEMASAAPTSRTLLNPTDKPAVSAWERRGAEKHHEENPFSDPANPFDNHASATNSPRPASPSSYASNTLVDNGDVATAAVVAAATGAAAANAARKPLPYPQDTPSPQAQRSVSPVSPEEKPLPQETSLLPAGSKPQRLSSNPVWVEDVPASPGPAPTGPPPMAALAHGPAPIADNVHRVQMDFKPSMDDELEIRAGQLVRMLHEYDDGWALCIRMDRSQQGVTPRSCLSKMPVKPRDGPPPQNRRPPPGARGPMGPGVPRPLTPNSGRNSPAPTSPANGRNSPRPRAHSNAQGHPRSMSPGPYGGGQQPQRPEMGGRRRSNSAGHTNARRQSPPGPSPMNPNQQFFDRKPVPGQAL